MNKQKPLCIYHGGCDDGFGAAFVVWLKYGDRFDYHPGVYQQDPPDVTGREVVMVDFSYKRPVLERMAESARMVLILDHHKTAAEDLDGYRRPIWGPQDMSEGIWAEFDMGRSGTGLAWDFLNLDATRPEWVNYIEDRDLWRKSLPHGDEFTICLRSYPQDFNVWRDLFRRGVGAMIEEGRAIQRYYRLRCEELKRHAYPTILGGVACWISNAPYFAASEVAGELCDKDGAVFGACYFEVERGKFQYSLRSRGDFDVSVVAKRFGGGGHKNAAGFTSFGQMHFVPDVKLSQIFKAS